MLFVNFTNEQIFKSSAYNAIHHGNSEPNGNKVLVNSP